MRIRGKLVLTRLTHGYMSCINLFKLRHTGYFNIFLLLHFQIDDLDDANILDSLMDQFPPPNILVYSTEEIIGLSPEHIVKCCQSFTQVKRYKILFNILQLILSFDPSLIIGKFTFICIHYLS